MIGGFGEMTEMHDLTLGEREGLPDSLAYLRGRYPSASWRDHPNYGALADFWMQVHDGLRTEGADLQALTHTFQEGATTPEQFGRTFLPLLRSHLGHLDSHHQVEDQYYFPRFRRLDERMKAGFDLLERDHEAIHQLLEQSAEGASNLLASLQRNRDAQRAAADIYVDKAQRLLALLDRHLGDEEDLVIPAMLEHGERPLF